VLCGSEGPSRSANDAGIQAAALADGSDLSPALTTTDVTIDRFTDDNDDPQIAVTVSWTFRTICNFPGVPSSLRLSRTVQMRVAPASPKESGS
jgi:hypothetical protein